MDKNSEKVKLNDELLDKVSGGWSEVAPRQSEGYAPVCCPLCRSVLSFDPQFEGTTYCTGCDRFVTV